MINAIQLSLFVRFLFKLGYFNEVKLYLLRSVYIILLYLESGRVRELSSIFYLRR